MGRGPTTPFSKHETNFWRRTERYKAGWREKSESRLAGGQGDGSSGSEGGPTGRGAATVTQALRERPQCPVCRGRLEADWRACPECGTEFGHAGTRATPVQSASGLPSVDTGEVAFVPVLGGARRPITVVEVGPAKENGPTVSLASLAVHRADVDRIPQEPLTEASRKPITVFREEEVEAPMELPDRARISGPEGTAPATTLAPTVVVMSPETPSQRRLDRADMAEIEQMIGEAVDRALRQYTAFQAPLQAALLAAPAAAERSAGKRVAAVGAGLLLGGAVADLVVLNWDVWVRGELVSAVGWIQQTGIIGMAALAGAGAAAFLLGALRAGRRAARAR